jgi:uncharacterized Zn finger protein
MRAGATPRRRRLPRHLLDAGPAGRTAHARRTVAITGPIATAWLAAVEAVLPQATRTIARKRLATAHTRRVTMAPGSVHAEVRQASYRNQLVGIRVPEVTEEEWARLLDVAAAHARWLAALAAGELPEELAAALVEAGLVPSGEALTADCTCRSGPGMCVHAAIAGQVAAVALSAEPGGMLVLRGMLPERVRERIVRRLPGSHAVEATRDPAGIDWNALVLGLAGALPAPPGPPSAPRAPAPLPAPPATSGLTADDLQALAADAAERAHGLLVAGGDGGLGLDADADLGRRVAAMPPARLRRLAEHSGADEAELSALAEAWRTGGSGGVAALRRSWHATPHALEPGIAALAAAGGDSVTWRMNRVIAGDGLSELALGRDALWYLLTRARRGIPLRLAAPGHSDPAVLLGGPEPDARAAEQLRLL